LNWNVDAEVPCKRLREHLESGISLRLGSAALRLQKIRRIELTQVLFRCHSSSSFCKYTYKTNVILTLSTV
jgi:hypothetical protein